MDVIILTADKIYQSNSAGAGRLMNIAKSLALEDNSVFLCSAKLNKNLIKQESKSIYNNIFLVGEERKSRVKKLSYYLHIISYMFRLHKFMKQFDSKPIIYLYPTQKSSLDFLCLLIFKLRYKYRIYCDVNEIRKTNLYIREFSMNFFKRFIEYIRYYIDLILFRLVEETIRYYDGIIAISTTIESYCTKYNHNIIRIPILSGNVSKPFKKQPIYNNNDFFNICFTGQINLKKEGFDILYEALSIIKKNGINFKLNLYGPISNKNTLLNDLPSILNIKENIFYHGIINRELLVTEIRKNHLLILPRPLHPMTHYGFSTKLAEYLISGIPTLVTDVSDNSVYIKDGENGFIVKPGNCHIMAEKLLYIIDNYNRCSEIIVNNAYELSRKKFYYGNYSKLLSYFLR